VGAEDQPLVTTLAIALRNLAGFRLFFGLEAAEKLNYFFQIIKLCNEYYFLLL
jgi:hypothetical protein